MSRSMPFVYKCIRTLFAKGEWAMAAPNILISSLCFAGRKIGSSVMDRINGEIAPALTGRGVALVTG